MPNAQQKLAAILAQQAVGPLSPNAHPTFNHEGPDQYAIAMGQNKQYAKPGPYTTKLDPKTETAFRTWVQRYAVPFDPNARVSDYDMRGYYQETNGMAHKEGDHFPDTYKTPRDTTFSNESKYAKKNTPYKWIGNTLVNVNTGQSVFN